MPALFPGLARAAEKQDTATIMAALDPELQPLREDAEPARPWCWRRLTPSKGQVIVLTGARGWADPNPGRS